MWIYNLDIGSGNLDAISIGLPFLWYKKIFTSAGYVTSMNVHPILDSPKQHYSVYHVYRCSDGNVQPASLVSMFEYICRGFSIFISAQPFFFRMSLYIALVTLYIDLVYWFDDIFGQLRIKCMMHSPKIWYNRQFYLPGTPNYSLSLLFTRYFAAGHSWIARGLYKNHDTWNSIKNLKWSWKAMLDSF